MATFSLAEDKLKPEASDAVHHWHLLDTTHVDWKQATVRNQLLYSSLRLAIETVVKQVSVYSIKERVGEILLIE